MATYKQAAEHWEKAGKHLEAEVERLEFINKKLLEDTPAVAKLQEAKTQIKVLREALLKISTKRLSPIDISDISILALQETEMNQEPKDHHTDLLEHLESKGTPEELATAIEEAEDKKP